MAADIYDLLGFPAQTLYGDLDTAPLIFRLLRICQRVADIRDLLGSPQARSPATWIQRYLTFAR